MGTARSLRPKLPGQPHGCLGPCAGLRFDRSLVPPSFNGTKWSTVVAPGLPHIQHMSDWPSTKARLRRHEGPPRPSFSRWLMSRHDLLNVAP